MGATTFEDTIPYIGNYGGTFDKGISNTLKTEKIYESTEDACINLRKYFPKFHTLPNTLISCFENLRNFNSKNKINGQVHLEDHLKGYLSTKANILAIFDGFNLEDLLNSESIDGMNEYMGCCFSRTLRRYRNLTSPQIERLKGIMESNYMTHIRWYMESGMATESQKNHGLYKDATTDKYKKIPEEQRIYLKDTIASLTEYKNNILNQYTAMNKATIFGDKGIVDDLEPLKLREIKKPYVEEKKTGMVSSLVNKVKGFFNKIF